MLRTYCRDWDGGNLLPELERDEVHHLVRVRRARIGEAVEVLNGRGDVGLAEVRECGSRSVQLELKSSRHVPRLNPPVHLLVAMPKGKTFPALLHKAVELGVAAITPLSTRNVEVDPNRSREKSDRWEAVLIEGIKQSGNPWLPVLHEVKPLEAAFTGGAEAQRICAALRPDTVPLWDLFENGLEKAKSVDVYVGPEGDFSPEEYQLLKDSGCRFVSLGPLVLKVETAASLVAGALRLWADSEKKDGLIP